MNRDTIRIAGTLTLYALGIFLAVYVHRYGWPAIDWATPLVGVIAAAAGAVAGAYAAFRLESRHRERVSDAGNAANGNQTLFDLWAIWNNLLQFRREALDPLVEKPEPLHWVELKAIAVPYESDGLLDPARFQFLLGTEAADLVAKLFIERQRYQLFLSQLRERNRIMREIVRPRWEAAGFEDGQDLTVGQLREAAGPNHYGELRDLTNNIKRFVPEDIESSMEQFRELRDYLVNRFPGHKFIHIAAEEIGE